MNRIDIEKYTDLDMNYSLEGANAYMLSPDMIKTIIETELGMSYDDMKKYVHGAKVNVTEEGIKKYIESCMTENDRIRSARFLFKQFCSDPSWRSLRRNYHLGIFRFSAIILKNRVIFRVTRMLKSCPQRRSYWKKLALWYLQSSW